VSALLATAAIGLAVWLLFGSAVLNYDAAWSLVWMRDLLVGAYDAEGAVVDPTRPLSGTFSRPLVPTPHPLTDAVSGLLAPVSLRAPAVSEQALLVLALAALGALGVVTYHLGARLGGSLVGILAAAMLLTREPVLAYGLRAYLDIPYTVLLLGAGLSALSGRSAATRTMVLLTLAGLLRPEAWAVAGAYWIYLAWTGPRLDRRLGLLAGVCAAAPLAWLATGWVIAGDPLLALTDTTATAEILQRRTGLLNGLVRTPRRLGEILRVEGLIGGVVGLTVAAMLWRSRRARTASPDAPSASDTARSDVLVGLSVGGASLAVALVVMGVAGLPINTRYLLPQGAIAVLAWAFAVAGWRSSAGGVRLRSWWKWAGLAVAAITVALIPWQVSRLRDMHGRLASERDAAHDLRTLATGSLDAGATDADRGSGCSLVVGTPTERTVPTILLWSQLSSWVVDQAAGAYLVQRVAEPGDEHFVLVPITDDVADGYGFSRLGDAAELLDATNGWRSVATAGDWSVLAAPHCAPS
jgi:hypothetical protein